MNVDHRPPAARIRRTHVDLLASAYCSAWNEADPQRRLHRLKSIWHADATYDSAAVHLRGLHDLNAHIGALRSGSGGWRFVVTQVTAHGPHVLLTWKLVDPAGRERLAGHDVGVCGLDRRFDRIVSFWHQAPSVPLAGSQGIPRMSGT